MNQVNEELISQELALRKARQEAAERDTAGFTSTIRTLRLISWFGALIPIIGIVIIGLGWVVGMYGSIFLMIKGNSNGGVRQLIITFVGAAVAAVAWIVVNLLFAGLLAAGA